MYFKNSLMFEFIENNEDDNIIYFIEQSKIKYQLQGDPELIFKLIILCTKLNKNHLFDYLINICNVDYCIKRLRENQFNNTDKDLKERFSKIEKSLLSKKYNKSEYIKKINKI